MGAEIWGHEQTRQRAESRRRRVGLGGSVWLWKGWLGVALGRWVGLWVGGLAPWSAYFPRATERSCLSNVNEREQAVNRVGGRAH